MDISALMDKAAGPAGPVAVGGLVVYVLAELAGMSPGTIRADRDVQQLTVTVEKLGERATKAEHELSRISYAVENNRAFIGDASGTLREINKALGEIQISVVKIDGRLDEIDRRTGAKGER